ncbi:MAG: M1 family metallopeptidase [Crocinitomicaceae bacterium]
MNCFKLLIVIFLLSVNSSFAQKNWQQEVNYTISVKLDDEKHTLVGHEQFNYINNSPDELTEMYIHLWPNAYSSKKTALAKQIYQMDDNDLTLGDDSLKGSISQLDFKVNGVQVKWDFEQFNSDICILKLNQPLLPGDGISVTTPFFVQIPSGSISRLGHVGQSYQITQWYPKPAVYDKNGWHQMPYLTQGEFYSEYGSFDVSITLPENYVVGATGDLQTPSEVEFLNALALKTAEELKNIQPGKKNYTKGSNDFPKTSSTKKTIRYTQKNVHDFAWFADKRYMVLKGEVELPHSKRMVTSWSMFTPRNKGLWSKSIEYINDATFYYSKWNGDYPYNQVTAVDGTISAGGGMEYPNVTVIGNSSSPMELEVVIVHEVGHNWFYGQLGTNERVHGWMDEGMNTLNEIRYVQTKYPNNTALSDMVLNGRFHLNDLDHHDMADISYRAIAGIGEDQPIETHSARFTSANYGIIMYQKTGLLFFYLKDYLGEELFDKCMQAYYREWEFRHPQPEDMRATLEQVSGKNLSWLFDDLIKTTNHIDYKIKSAKKTDAGYIVKTKNVGQVDGPIEINGILNDSVLESVWIEPGNKKNEILLSSEKLDEIRIDHGKDIPEMSRQNNSWSRERLFNRFEPLKFEFLIGDHEPERTRVFWTPTIAGNAYDKFMIGVAIHNYGAPTSKFNYIIAPFYSFGRQMVSGMSDFNYTFLPKKNLKTSRFGVSIKSFKNDSTFRNNDSYYIAVSPYWIAKIGNRKNSSPISQYIKIQSIYKKDKVGPTHLEHLGAYVEYNFDYTKVDHNINIKLRNEYYTDAKNSDELGRVLLESTYRFRYMKKKMNRWIELRGFIGHTYLSKFSPITSYQYSMSLSGADGQQDLFIDEYYFGRNETRGIWSQQRDENMGGFKSTSWYGTTAYTMATANLYFQFPIKPNIFGVFADFGTFYNGSSFNGAINTGLALRLGKIFGVYFPVWMSKQMDAAYNSQNYAERIRFTLKMNIQSKPINFMELLN